MANIVDLNDALLTQLTTRSGEQDLALLGIGQKVLQEEEDFIAICAGLIKTDVPADVDSKFSTSVDNMAPLHSKAQDLDTRINAGPARQFATAFPHLMGSQEDSRAVFNTAREDATMVMNYRDEDAGKTYFIKAHPSGNTSVGSLSLNEFDETTGVITELWEENFNDTTGWNTTHGLMVLPLANDAGTEVNVCVVAIHPGDNNHFKVWEWDGTTLTSHDTSAIGGNDQTYRYVAYDMQEHRIYARINSGGGLRVIYSDATEDSPTDAETPRGVPFVGWNEDIFAADMQTRMLLPSYNSEHQFWYRDRLRMTNAAFEHANNRQIAGWASTGQYRNTAGSGQFFFNYNIDMLGNNTTSTLAAYATAAASTDYTPFGSSAMLIKKSGGLTWATETMTYGFEYDVMQHSVSASYSSWWPSMMNFTINRWELTERTPKVLQHGRMPVHIYPRRDTPNASAYDILAMVPQWWSTAKRRFGLMRHELYPSPNNTAAGVHWHEMYAY